jgi:2,3-diketo-5-methylthio-1-phosphopentane phosphatase
MSSRRIEPLSSGDLIFSDFDGTISVIDTGIAVIEALDLKEAWTIEEVWRRGEIDSMECLSRQWAMVKLPPVELYALLDSFPMREEFPRFVDFVRGRGARIVVVSDGLDFYVDRLLGDLGITTCEGDRVLDPACDCMPRFANHAVVTEAGVQIDFPHRTPICAQCGNCKLHHLFRLRPHFRRIIYIGDGHSDKCPARYADVLFARHHLAEEAARLGLDFTHFESFDEIATALS